MQSRALEPAVARWDDALAQAGAPALMRLVVVPKYAPISRRTAARWAALGLLAVSRVGGSAIVSRGALAEALARGEGA